MSHHQDYCTSTIYRFDLNRHMKIHAERMFNCALCRRCSKAYLQHLFKVGDAQAQRLATAHNLRFYGRLMENLRNG